MRLPVVSAVVMLSMGVCAPAFGNAELAKSKNCMGCHAVDAKRVGPSYQDVAAKYKGRKDAASMLMEKIRKGGSGVWGQIPMPPANPPLSDSELKTLLAWILAGAK
jgi:cytochrome c